MSDESFFREVNEEIRQDRTRILWARYGRWLMACAVLAILIAAGYVAWREYSISRANASGDSYLAALDLASAGKTDEALNALGELSENGYGAYKDLAQMRAASVLETKGDSAAAVAAFDAVAADSGAPKPIRNMASVRAAYILVDTGTVDYVGKRVQQLSGDSEPLRYAAREAMGLAAWKAGDLPEAKRLFEQLRDDQGTPGGISLRTRLLLELIAAGNVPVALDATPTAPTPAEGLDPSIAVPEMPTTAPATEAPATEAPATDAPATGATPPAPAADAAPAAPSAPTAPAADPAVPAPAAETPAAAPAAPDAPSPAAGAPAPAN